MNADANATETSLEQAGTPGLIIDGLALLPEKTLLDEGRLAAILHVGPRTIHRMSLRGQIPPAIRLGKRKVWIVGRVIAHIEGLAERAARDAERQAKRIAQLSP